MSRRAGSPRPSRRRPTSSTSCPTAFQVGLVAFSTGAAGRGRRRRRTARRSTTRSTRSSPTAAPRSATRSRRRSRRPADATAADPSADARSPRTRRVAVRTPSASPAPSPSAPPDPTSRRSWRRCSCPTAPTRPASSSRSTPPSARPRPGVPVYTIALGTAGRRPSRSRTTSASSQTLEVPPDTETLAAIAETTGARFFDAPTAEDLAADLREPRLEGRVHRGAAGGHPAVRCRPASLFVLAGAGLAAHWFNRFP